MSQSETEEFRRACEARHVLNMPTKEARRQYLRMVEEKRGIQAREYLEKEIMRLYRESRN